MSKIKTINCITDRQPEMIVDKKIRNRFQDILDEWCSSCIGELCETCDICRLFHFVDPKAEIWYGDLILVIPDGTIFRFVSSNTSYKYEVSVIDLTHIKLIRFDQVHGTVHRTVYHSAQLGNLLRQNADNISVLIEGEWVPFREIIKEENN